MFFNVFWFPLIFRVHPKDKQGMFCLRQDKCIRCACNKAVWSRTQIKIQRTMRLPKVCRMFQGCYDLLGTSEINFYVIFVIARPTLFCLLSMAPCCSSRSIIILLPRLQAIWRGVHPFCKKNKHTVNCVVFREHLWGVFLNVKQTTHFQFEVFTPSPHTRTNKKQTNLPLHTINHRWSVHYRLLDTSRTL